jgi:hypothetical protein
MNHPGGMKHSAGMSGRAAARLELARMVVRRLERLSADSAWAHAASGYRGALVRQIDQLERASGADAGGDAPEPETAERLDFLIDKGLQLLARAAFEMGDPEPQRRASQPREPGPDADA